MGSNVGITTRNEVMKNDSVSIPMLVTLGRNLCGWWSGLCIWCMEGMVDAVIRLYLKAYKPAELVQLYNALSLVRAAVSSPAPSHVAADLDEIMVYLLGYMDAKGEYAK